MSLWSRVPQKEGRLNPAFGALSRVLRDCPAHTAVVTLVAGRELSAGSRQAAVSVRVLGLEVGNLTQACFAFLDGIGLGLSGLWLPCQELISVGQHILESESLFLHTQGFIS